MEILADLKHGNAVPLIGYSVMALWLVVGFGIVDGLWKHTLKMFVGNLLAPRVSDYFAGAPIGSYPYEAVGILVLSKRSDHSHGPACLQSLGGFCFKT